MFDWEDICQTLLGITPVNEESLVRSMVKLKWLRKNILPLEKDSNIQKIHAHAKHIYYD